MRYIIVLLVLLITACGGDGGDDPDDKTSGPPVLKRALNVEHECSTERAPQRHTPAWPGNTPRHATVATSSNTFVIRSQQEDPFGFDPAKLMITTVDRAGNFGAPQILAEGIHGGVGATRDGDGFVAVWWLQQLHFARFDGGGSLIGSVKELATPGSRGIGTTLISRPDGFALFFSAYQENTPIGLHLLLLDRDGNAAGAAILISGDETLDTRAIFEDGGFTIAWIAQRNREGAVAAGEVFFAKLAADGSILSAPQKLSDPPSSRVVRAPGFAAPRVGLIKIGSGYLTAWTEVKETASFNETGAYAVVLVARLDGNGAIKERVLLDEVEEEFDHEEPLFTQRRDGKVLLSWSRAGHIYACGGCFPDNALRAVVLDPEKLEPRSEVLVVAPPSDGIGNRSGGMISHQLTSLGDDLLATFEVQFHTSNNAGTAVLSCR